MPLRSRPLVRPALPLLALLACTDQEPPTTPGLNPNVGQAAVLVVTTLDDAGPGSLRQAILDAPDGSTITFAVAGVIDLASELSLNKNLTISGPGADNLTLRRPPGTASNMFLQLSSSSVSITDLTIDGSGGCCYGILSIGNLTLSNVVLTGHVVAGSSGAGLFAGGGIGKSTTIRNSTISGNSSPQGAGIFSNTVLTIVNSTISGNQSPASPDAGPGTGGGIQNNGGTLTVINSTITGNSADGEGGGIQNLGRLTLLNSLVALNVAPVGPDLLNATAFGGTIIRAESNLIGNGLGHPITHGTGGNIVSVTSSQLKLGALQNNGGPTPTHALLAGSRAIDAGDNAVCAAAPVSGQDQRGIARPQGPRCDIGAFEFEPPAPLVVTTLADAGPGSLRQAILDAPDGSIITFAVTGVIDLASELSLNKSLTISGPGADLLTLRRPPGTASNMFLQLSSSSVSITDLTIDGSGGCCYGILSIGTLTLSNVMLTGNVNPNGSGAGLFAGGGIGKSTTIRNSTISGNSSPQGGGIWSNTVLTLVNSTISGNASPATPEGPGTGGGIQINGGTFIVINSTITGNSADAEGGGIQNLGRLTLLNSLVALNGAPTGPDLHNTFPGTIISAESNLIGSGSGHPIANGTSGNIVGVTVAQLMLGPLQNNGGPTPTHALLAGSPAVDAGANATCAAAPVGGQDQRTVFRPQGSRCDIGAYELEPPPSPTPAGSNVMVSPTDPVTGTSPVALTFADVTASGETTLTTSSQGPPAPAGFSLGDPPVYYDVSTTASFTGLVTICIDYSGVSFVDETMLRLLHGDGAGNWTDVTTTLDTANDIICGETPSLSPFLIAQQANVAPVITAIALPENPVAAGVEVSIGVSFTDPDLANAHDAVIEWGDGTSSAVAVPAGARSFNVAHTYTTPGVYTVRVTVSDGLASDTESSAGFLPSYIVVYDPSAGFVTGGGWIDSPPGAYTPDNPDDPDYAGKATFGFVSRYERGAATPTGQTEFQFQVAHLDFHSASYEWLVVSGARAQYKGSGTINGGGDYGFILTAIDGQLNGGTGSDKLRIKIWDKTKSSTDPNYLVYDNQVGATDTADPATMIGGGSIMIRGK